MGESWSITDITDRLKVRILDSRSLQIGPAWASADVRSSFWRLYLNDSAGARLRLDDGVYELTPARVHIVPAWVRFTCSCTAVVKHFYVHFDAIGLPGALVRRTLTRPLAATPDAVARAAIENARGGGDMVTGLWLKAAVCAALARVVAQLPHPARAALDLITRGDHAVYPAVLRMESHLHRPLRNAALAALCHVSEDHFIRLFRRLMGQTPRQYIAERRVVRASEMLAFGSASIEQIATATGFANRFSFTREFSRRMGVPPAQFRRSRRV